MAAQGRATRGMRAYLYQLRCMLRVADRLLGRPVIWTELLRDDRPLGRVVVDDTAPALDTRLSKWMLAPRRSAIRDFVTLMRPELLARLGEAPHAHLDRALHDSFLTAGPGDRLQGSGVGDAYGERLLASFRRTRLADGAHPQSVRREMSQLRSLLREARVVGPNVSLGALFSDMELLAQTLAEPSALISQHTGRTRLLAAQRFIRIIGPPMGRDPVADLIELDARLPARRPGGWHTTDLRRIVDAAGHGAGPYA